MLDMNIWYSSFENFFKSKTDSENKILMLFFLLKQKYQTKSVCEEETKRTMHYVKEETRKQIIWSNIVFIKPAFKICATIFARCFRFLNDILCEFFCVFSFVCIWPDANRFFFSSFSTYLIGDFTNRKKYHLDRKSCRSRKSMKKIDGKLIFLQSNVYVLIFYIWQKKNVSLNVLCVY